MTDSEDLETLEPGPAIPPPTIPRPQQPPQQQQPNGVTRPLPTIGFQPPFSMPSAPMNGATTTTAVFIGTQVPIPQQQQQQPLQTAKASWPVGPSMPRQTPPVDTFIGIKAVNSPKDDESALVGVNSVKTKQGKPLNDQQKQGEEDSSAEEEMERAINPLIMDDLNGIEEVEEMTDATIPLNGNSNGGSISGANGNGASGPSSSISGNKTTEKQTPNDGMNGQPMVTGPNASEQKTVQTTGPSTNQQSPADTPKSTQPEQPVRSNPPTIGAEEGSQEMPSNPASTDTSDAEMMKSLWFTVGWTVVIVAIGMPLFM